MYNQYPDIELRETLAAQMGVSESCIQVFKLLELKFKKSNFFIGLVQKSTNTCTYSTTSTT